MLYMNQNKLLYMPNPPGFPPNPEENPRGWRSPEEWRDRIPMKFTFEERMVKTADGEEIHTWLILHENSNQVPTVIYFHGNAGNMGFRLKNAMGMFSKSGVNVLMMDYRGYGKSTGEPTEDGLNMDGDAVVQHATSHPLLQGSPLVCFGRSLGGSVAVSLAARWPAEVQAVVLENTYTCIGDMVDKLMPFLRLLKTHLLTIKWDSDKKIQQLTQPIFFVSGDSDELVPTAHMAKLHQLATKSRLSVFYSVKGGTHNDTWERAGSMYYERLKDFLTKAFESGPNAILRNGSPMSNSGSDEDFIKISQKDILEDQDPPDVALPTMSTNFRVN